MVDINDIDYPVGYRRPPKETRFKPGRSGNPKGRPKGSKNHKTILAELFDDKIRPDPKGRKTPRMKVAIQNLVDKALADDWTAIKQVLRLMTTYDILPEVSKYNHNIDFEALAAKYGNH